MLKSLFNKVAGLQVFSCEFCESFKSSYFIEHLRWLLQQMFRFTLYFQKDVVEYLAVMHCIIVSFWNRKSLSAAAHMRLACPARWTGSCRWDDFYPTFIWNLLSQFNQDVRHFARKRLFDQVVFRINSDVRHHAEQTLLYYIIKTSGKKTTTTKTKLIKENSTPTCRAGPLARVHMVNFHLTLVGSRQNQVT